MFQPYSKPVVVVSSLSVYLVDFIQRPRGDLNPCYRRERNVDSVSACRAKRTRCDFSTGNGYRSGFDATREDRSASTNVPTMFQTPGMAYSHNRGTKDEPKYYQRYKGHDGKWHWAPSWMAVRTKAASDRLCAEIEERVAQGKQPIPERRKDAPLMAKALETWAESLQNRNAQDDRSRMRRHVLPRFRTMRVDAVDLASVLEWIDAMNAAKELSEPSRRANLNLLSRFFSWAVSRKMAPHNPVRLVPVGERPRAFRRTDTPWLDDDKQVRDIVRKLPEPFSLMFYLCNRSGLRLGEVCGLRISDLGFLHEGVIRVRFSYNGPLKEDKRQEGRVKWVPAAEDAEPVLADWLARRKAAEAKPEDLAFPNQRGNCFDRMAMNRAWREHVPDGLTWYEATRHSFVSQKLTAGASLDEVSAAVGHANPSTTKRHYDHFIRKSFSSELRRGLGLAANKDGKVIQMKRRKKS